MPDLASGYAGKRVLVTGGLGFIGSNLAIRLVRAGADVTVVDSLIPDHGANLFNLAPVEGQVRVNMSDVRDTHSTSWLVRGQDVIFSLAGQVSHVDSMTDPVTDLEINATSQLTLLEACRAHNPGARLVLSASRQQYGRPRYLPVDEDHPMVPIDVNGINKAAGEMYFLLYNEVYGMETCSLRLTNTYGPRMQMLHPRQGFIPWLVRLAIEGREIEVFGDGSQVRDFNYVDDVVDALLLAGTRPEVVGKAWNLGHREPASLKTFVETLLGVSDGGGGFRLVPFPEERARIDIGSVYADFSRYEAAVGWTPQVDLAEGLSRMVEYYREHHDRYW